MKKLTIVILIIVAGAFSAIAQKPGQDAARAFAMLQGTWKVDGRETYEKWESADSVLCGKGYKIKNGVEIVTEQLEIKLIDGVIYYLATVANQNEGATVRFKLTESGSDVLVFENPEHDFPKKIIYRKVNDDEIAVQVLGAGDKGFSQRFLRQKPAAK
jgi:hypothetical protein